MPAIYLYAHENYSGVGGGHMSERDRDRERETWERAHPVYLTLAYIVGRPVIGRTRIECIALERNIRLTARTAAPVLIRDARREMQRDRVPKKVLVALVCDLIAR